MKYVSRCYAETEPGIFRQFSSQKFGDAKYGRLALGKFAGQRIRFILFEGWLDSGGRVAEIDHLHLDALAFDKSGSANGGQACAQLWQALERSDDYVMGRISREELDAGPALYRAITLPEQVRTIRQAVEQGQRKFDLAL